MTERSPIGCGRFSMVRFTVRDLAIAAGLAALMLFARRETLTLPPYQDQATGYWTEADFLADTSFNYYELLYGVNHYMDYPPGPRSYMISILPTLLAALMKLVPSVPAQIVIVRSLSFFIGGLLVVVLYRCVRHWTGPAGALAVCCVYATLPLFLTQLEIMGMDVPLALAMTLSLLALMDQAFLVAAAWGIVAFAFKATGLLAFMVALTYLALVLMLGWRLKRLADVRGLSAAFVMNAVLLAALWGVVRWGDTSVSILSGYEWPAILKPPYSIITLTPELGILGIVAASLTMWRIFEVFVQKEAKEWLGGVFDFIGTDRVASIAWIALIGLVASSWLFIYTPRYVFCVVPILFVVLAREVFARPSLRPWIVPVCLVLASFNLANAHGRLYPPVSLFRAEAFDQIASLTPRLCVFTERSREYLSDHRSNVAAVRQLEREHEASPIFAAIPYLFALENPALGYVTNSLRAYDATSFDAAIGHFLDLYAPQQGEPETEDPIFVLYGDSRLTVPAPEDGDELLYIDALDPPLQIYRKRLPAGLRGDRSGLEDWYVRNTWSTQWAAERISSRSGYLLSHGKRDRLLRELKEALENTPDDPVLLENGRRLLEDP